MLNYSNILDTEIERNRKRLSKWHCIRYENLYIAYRDWDGWVVWISQDDKQPYFPVGWNK